jgi:hypothetical protein
MEVKHLRRGYHNNHNSVFGAKHLRRGHPDHTMTVGNLIGGGQHGRRALGLLSSGLVNSSIALVEEVCAWVTGHCDSESINCETVILNEG